MRTVTASRLAALIAILFAAGNAGAETADPASDAPETRIVTQQPLPDAASYGDALKGWRTVEDVNAWIGARFEYDLPRAVRLSETQRTQNARLPIHAPQDFFASPRGVCVDLARFGVETLRAVDPKSRPAYVMIEFDPVSISGNTLRRHWVVSFERNGQRFFFADSKRPGHIAGPYATTQAFIDDYSRYRGRRIVAFRERESYERTQRTLAARQSREETQ